MSNSKKIYISVDMEGVTGVAHWDEVTRGTSDYLYYQQQLNKEVKAVCDGINVCGNGNYEIYVKDGHWEGRNVVHADLPENVILIRGDVFNSPITLFGLDDSFSAVFLVGYHSHAGSSGNVLAHTVNDDKYNSIMINNILASEFLLEAYEAAYKGVPVVFLSGDDGICTHAESIDSKITTFKTHQCIGGNTISQHPRHTEKMLKNLAAEVTNNLIKDDYKAITLPNYFDIEITFKEHKFAHKASFYSGVQRTGPCKVSYKTEDYFEVCRLLYFMADAW